jgi:homoserine acetyltransferase
MGLVDSPDAFYLATSSSLTSNVVGFYDDETGRLVVRGVAWSPEMEYTLVHELTHALQQAGAAVTYAEIPSPYGHDAFLLEPAQQHAYLAPFLTRVLEEVAAR